ncbi:MAG TPA: hypothetical protein V6C76_12345 [Drouetiella sp.]
MIITSAKVHSLLLSSALLLQCGLPVLAAESQVDSQAEVNSRIETNVSVAALQDFDVAGTATTSGATIASDKPVSKAQAEEDAKTEAAIRKADAIANAQLPKIVPVSSPEDLDDVQKIAAATSAQTTTTIATATSALTIATATSATTIATATSPTTTATATSATATTLPTTTTSTTTTATMPDSSDTILRGGVSSDPVVAGRQVEELTRQILLKLIEMERFNLHYTLETAKQGRWKGWRYAFFQEINSGCNLAGSIISTGERGSHLRNSANVSRVVQQRANIVPMIGSIVGACAAALEFGINEYHDVVARSKGFAPRAARLHITALKKEVDGMLAQREELLRIEQSSPALTGRAEIDAAEGKVLRDLRDESVMEFERFQIGARKIFAFQQSQYLLDCTKYTLNAIGSYFAYKSLHARDRRWNGRAGVMWDISGPLTMFAPIISRAVAKAVGEGHKAALRRGLTKDAHEITIAKLDADRALLDQLCRNTTIAHEKVETAVTRAAMYEDTEKKYSTEITNSQKSAAKARTTATQNIGAGMYVGASRLASGILFTIPGFGDNWNKKTARANRVTNTNLFAAAVVGIPANTFSMLDTMRIQVQGEVTRHRLKKSGMLPSQIANGRLKQLDDMQARLGGSVR